MNIFMLCNWQLLGTEVQYLLEQNYVLHSFVGTPSPSDGPG